MKNLIIEDAEVTKIYKTMDYDKFKFVKGNRRLNTRSYLKLLKSMSEEQLIIPILVSQDYSIIDGQHRFTCARELGLPIYYYMIPDYSIAQVKRANLVSSVWTKEDYLNMYIEEENSHYISFKDLLDESEMNISDLIKLFSMAQIKPLGKINYEFELGTFTCDGIASIRNFLFELEAFSFFKGYKTQSFVAAFIKLYTHPAYNPDKLFEKLETRKNSLENIRTATVDEYLSILCNKIYSFGPGKANIFYDMNTKRFYN